ncbi:sugar phosphate isomerase/epimerase family protein [Amycolatopsis regifaucium]|uniref:Inosose dehydratase n=1 Tax=Amycolatopsis regifaucium TaxID=546365 RepID=A0A154MC92_9PSEU|nr:sugar phosphate isomerase/epimerase [Amycolatopsis regifaucium]KZB81319.1 inosose dehydratase [Amycolatopsis regifaucium]OKA04585.1 inosose dehydratase [Amycolatopsis regifaucium]SFH34594.1 2-keto-myo-inositol dehydratase [Amycolatopsis regifaucium]
MTSRIRIAAAPISWGVCEVPGWGRVLDTGTVLGEMADLGVRATELGPPGYLPRDPAALRELLGGYRLDLVGGFLAVVLHKDPEAALAEAEESAALFAACGGDLLVLAAATGLDGYDDKPKLTDAEWATLIETSGEIAKIAERHGLRTVLHPHVGTQVETEAEVERFLADSVLPLCLDTGHLLIGGTDPVALAGRHPDRIGHLHLKDVRGELAEDVRAGRLPYAEAVGQGLYVPLGDGDVDIEAMIRSVHEAGYAGWYVLEQDTALSERSPEDLPKRDVARSLAHLEEIVSRLPAAK